MKTRNIFLMLSLVSLASFFSLPASGQVTIPFDVVGNGGGFSSSGVLRLSDTVGEMTIGLMSQGSILHKIGFQYVLNAFEDTSVTAVMITAFRAEYSDEGVKLEWEIGHADGLEGFNIYRSKSFEEKFVRLTKNLIPPEKGNTYLDSRIRPGVSYTYRLGAVDDDGEFYSQAMTVEVPYKETALEQNYPNPFNPSTTISFFLAEPEHVVLTIYNVQGKRVKMLFNGKRGFGKHKMKWNGQNDHGSSVSSGVYYYRLKAGNRAFTKKLTILK